VDAEYARHYRALYEHHWWWRAREAAILDVLRRYHPPNGWRRVLDVGCGDGLFFESLTEFAAAVDGVEPTSALVTDAGRKLGTIYEVPFDERFVPGHRYGLIVMLDVLEHLDRPGPALAQAMDLLDSGGTVVITVPAFHALWTRHDEVNHHRTRYTRSTFAQMAEGAALEIDWTEYCFHWTFPVKLMQRAIETFIPGQPRPPSIPVAPINHLLYLASRLEHTLLAPLRLPFGSSLLVVGGRPGERDWRQRGQQTKPRPLIQRPDSRPGVWPQ
jgi:SAM-dependent methyltransferase